MTAQWAVRGETFQWLSPGVPSIRDLRFPVATVVGMVADGMSFAEIVSEHPDLEEGDIREALRFAAKAVSERELPLREPTRDSWSRRTPH